MSRIGCFVAFFFMGHGETKKREKEKKACGGKKKLDLFCSFSLFFFPFLLNTSPSSAFPTTTTAKKNARAVGIEPTTSWSLPFPSKKERRKGGGERRKKKSSRGWFFFSFSLALFFSTSLDFGASKPSALSTAPSAPNKKVVSNSNFLVFM